MLFPLIADIVLAMPDATFGIPEIRRGILPGVVAVVARRRLNDRQCRRFMLTGDSFNVSEGISMGFVDHVLPPYDNTELSLQGILQTLLASENLRECKAIMNAQGDLKRCND